MSDPAPKKFNRDSMSNTLIVAIGISLVCSVLVASAAVILKPRQERNEEEFRQRIILDVAGLYQPGGNIAELYSGIEEQTVTLGSGDTGIVYIVRDNGQIGQVILPIEGSGLWGMMYGFLAVDADGETVRGLQFYEHAETPGLGANVDRPDWQAQWQGKKLYDASGAPQIEIIKGDASNDSEYEIDGLAGATLTGRGVNQFVHYWIGDEGYGPYLQQLGEKESQ